MLRTLIPITIVSGTLLAAAPAAADPWKDESGHGKHWKEDWGETPWWGRGKGYWDGHFKEGYWRSPVYAPAPYYGPVHSYCVAPPAPRVYYYGPARSPFHFERPAPSVEYWDH